MKKNEKEYLEKMATYEDLQEGKKTLDYRQTKKQCFGLKKRKKKIKKDRCQSGTQSDGKS